MPRVFRSDTAEKKERAGYEAKYLADILLKSPIDSLGFIVVTIPPGVTTEPHYHSQLDEVFVAITPVVVIVDFDEILLNPDDILIAEAGEKHSFRPASDNFGRLLAIKMPNVKDDKST